MHGEREGSRRQTASEVTMKMAQREGRGDKSVHRARLQMRILQAAAYNKAAFHRTCRGLEKDAVVSRQVRQKRTCHLFAQQCPCPTRHIREREPPCRSGC